MSADDNRSAQPATRRDFLKASALAAAAAGGGVGTAQASGASQTAGGGGAAAQPAGAGAPAPAAAPGGAAKDPYAIAARFRKFLRVTDVTDGLDAVGRADLTLMDAAIRPLWMGMSFWGPAVTMRVVPIEVAEDVLAISARIAVDDKRSRRRLYDRLGRKPDETVDWEAAAEFFKDLL